QIEGAIDGLARDPAADGLVPQHQVTKVPAFLPDAHGVALHCAVGVLAGNSVFDQVEQKLATEDQAASALQIEFHLLRINEHGVEHVCGLLQNVIHQGGGIGND